MGATHFLLKRLANIKTEMLRTVLAYDPTREINTNSIGLGKCRAKIGELLRLIQMYRASIQRLDI